MRPPMIRWRAVIQSYPCELCMAGPGDPCRTLSGTVKYEPHGARANTARDNHWEAA